VPALTHVAAAHAVELVGATPVFVDCEAETGNIDAGRAESLVTRHTRALSLVHFVGIPCVMDAVMEVAERHGLKVVEDCALAVGGWYGGRHVGLFGDAGTFSFYPIKHITTAEGGMFVTRHAEAAEAVRKTRAFGVDRGHTERSRPGVYEVNALGLNYRMSELEAALGRGQLGRIEENLRRRRENFATLKSGLEEVEGVRIIDAVDERVQSSYYCLSVVLRGRLRGRRDELAVKLKDAGVGTSVYYPQPVPRMPYYREKYGYQAEAFPRAEEISDQSLALPVGPHVRTEDAAYIAERFGAAVKEILV
jgi:perosamine synthetase